MGVHSFTKALLLAGAAVLPLSQLVAAQTIVVDDGIVIAANETTVAPAAEVVELDSEVPLVEADVIQLTDAVLANLTALQLTNISLFGFPADEEEGTLRKRDVPIGTCRVFPGDSRWPSKLVWFLLDLLTGGALIETVPIGAVCYPNSGVYDAAKCQTLKDNWTKGETHAEDPTSVMSPLYQGETCMPDNGGSSTCKLGGFPSYAVAVRNVAQIQLAVNFARNANLRLVVKNTGHDFLGKSAGAGALSIWTHKLKSINYIKSIKTKSYSGPAFKLGAGVQVNELYEAAHKYGFTAVGGECPTVGVTGGYLAGGGHSPVSSIYGMGSDQVLSIDVVLPNGRFITADETHNTDLFWAIRGGGGATFGVVTSMTVKVHPKISFSGAKWTILAGPAFGIPEDVFWGAIKAYWRKFPAYAEQGSYGYSTVFGLGPGAGYIWTMQPWLVPGMSLADFKTMIAPLLAEWAELGFPLEPTYFEHDNFYDTWTKNFPDEAVANSNMRTAARLFPATVWDNATALEDMLDAVKAVVEDGSALIQYNIKADAPTDTPDSAVNTHWREAAWFGIMGAAWSAELAADEIEVINRRITDNWMERLRAWGPGSYLNEGDVMEPNFGEAYFGTNYERLLQIKRQVDPNDLFWAPTAVGSGRWAVSDQGWLTKQTGRLCRVGET
ncbi:hypothetical protein B0H66DRAFT_485854 [Apodospora peruviana]|uniref:FAD-binding PCMH-type domain-containing protein n=1 Tax=Apodospora peruviana TaxID=516989 RepID=A0AAE0HTF0_9PEZI|nr:hypothetical protein B0H66DRAFT_485854 [Apodospora peruviana]